MSALTLRRAAAEIRAENVVRDGELFCRCEDDGAWTDHWFDRSICPEPCGMMHDICVECCRIKGRCLVAETGRENGNRISTAWLAVADLLDLIAGDFPDDEDYGYNDFPTGALVVADAYLSGIDEAPK